MHARRNLNRQSNAAICKRGATMPQLLQWCIAYSDCAPESVTGSEACQFAFKCEMF